ncbi:MAG: hypothetical protein CL927_15870 [Deltaproteobacteria bacterium]|mgnify:CR=1 FL=1|nr:hypothetical protein [Deltaproteobacteria bacterium]HCH63260.1 hypothetical protein [Deltaproteobacteria bacterium]
MNAPDSNTPPASKRRLMINDRLRRALVLVLVAVASALLVVEFSGPPPRAYTAGEVADRDVFAQRSFEYVDKAETNALRMEAEETVRPVFTYDGGVSGRIQNRIRTAFDTARQLRADALLEARAEGREELSRAELSDLSRKFLASLQVRLDPEELDLIADNRWSEELETRSIELLAEGMTGFIIANRNTLPVGEAAVTVLRLVRDGDTTRQEETILYDFSRIAGPSDARQTISLLALEDAKEASAIEKSAITLARAAVRPNFAYDQRETVERRQRAVDSVPEVVLQVSSGTSLARTGEVLTDRHVAMIAAMSSSRARFGSAPIVLSLMAILGLLAVGVYQYARGAFPRQTANSRDLEAAAVLLLLVLATARLIVGASTPLGLALENVSVNAFWYLVPVAGGAMLVRILLNAELALIWTILVAVILGLMMDQDVLFTLFFVLSGVTAAGAVAGSRERVAVLKAGFLAGLFNAAAALLLSLVQVYLQDPVGINGEAAALPLSAVLFAFIGGVLSGVLVLGLVPVFELFGFVTDYRLLELANLNHPLLRQLMLRAPGTYHHSVTVAQLSEAAAEAIGANALQTRVACYFHDIGKAVQPKYFIENQRGGPNPHDKLPPRTSARVIINHVVDGEGIALQYKLPQPVIDGIVMHHGTGLIQYFYAMALKEAKPGEVVREADFRYPGRLPDTREAGIMMLADKVEAATRTLKDKSPESLRGLIQKLVNATLMDGQLEKCPLTIKDLYTIIDAFVETLLGIYHHRIDYPGIPSRSEPTASPPPERPSGPVITLEIQNPLVQQHTADSETADPVASPDAAAPATTEPQSGPIDPQTGLPFMRPQRTITPDEDYESADHIPTPYEWARGNRDGK